METWQTMVLTEANGRTTFTQTTLYPSREELDAAMQSGASGGMEACFDRLEDMLLETA
jgi:uncharacterized protein YndB with AHSA1/START domain